MRPSKRIISKENIELEIYNTFELFKQDKNIRIADCLNKFDVNLFKNKRYRSIDYTYEALIRVFVKLRIYFRRAKSLLKSVSNTIFSPLLEEVNN